MERPVYRLTHLAIAVALLGTAFAAWGHEHPKEHPTTPEKPKAEEKSQAPAASAAAGQAMTGEVVDMACYVNEGEKGKEHRKCARSCVLERHAPAGLLLPDGALYLLLEDHGNAKAYKAAINMAGGNAKLTGNVVERNGIKGLVVEKAEPAK